MTRQYFGTDGIRGRVGEPPMTVDFALRLASAAASVLAPSGGSVLIGKDTRVSGYMFESALEAGFVASGLDVGLLGPLPTPGIAYLTQALNADFGVVISASHNAYDDNGIKFFDRHGLKLSDELEARIEAALDGVPRTRDSSSLGKAEIATRARSMYQEFCRASFPADQDLAGIKVVIDCAHGAAYKVAPRVLAELEADLVPVGCSPNGRNINAGCGSTRPDLLQMTVPGVRADLGIALDGDGDRLVMVDNKGNVIDGDQLLYILAIDRRSTGELRGPVVGTVMSNLGLERALLGAGIGFQRAKVGDRHVLSMLQASGGILGGETSGHLLCLDRTTTGDGLIAALQVLAVMRRTGRGLDELAAGMERLPQVLVNVRLDQPLVLDEAGGVREAVLDVERTLGDRGRVVLRPSGTEPVIRVMVEGESDGEIRHFAAQIADAVREAAASGPAQLIS
ncbi:MAG: phosphoglucosamine mutase [Gammaproteobacteria bacterium]|nr:MAG: phosphoglucosamine mutase [Gammaproteobacteria bacterium]